MYNARNIIKGLVRRSKATLPSQGQKHVDELNNELVRRGLEIIALKAIVANLRKQQNRSYKLYYNPNKHSEPTIRVAEIFGSYIISRQHGPVVLSKKQWVNEYGHYVELIRIDNSNVV